MRKSQLLRSLPFLLLALIAVLAAGCAAGLATPAAEQPSGGVEAPSATGEVMTLYVGPFLADCVGVAPQQCLQVKTSPDGEYQLFYDTIQGFEFEEGYEYEIIVSRTEVENPPADASKYQYSLVEVVSKSNATVQEVSQVGLEGVLWKLESIAATNGLAPVLPDSQATARFIAGQVGGNASCNTFFGTYQLDGSSLTIEMGGSTMMACEPPELMQQEIAYLTVLGQTASYEITGDQLVLKDASGNALLRYTAFISPPLVGTNWNVMTYNNGKGGLTTPLAGSEISLLLAEDGTVSGAAGCNRYSGGYQVDGNSITIGPLVTTRMMCNEPEGVMDQEFAFTNALQQAASFEILGAELTLLDAEGTTLVKAQELIATPLSSTPWNVLTYNNGKDALVSALAGTEISLLFAEDGTVSGAAGCNNYSGGYQVDGNAITIGPLITTRMMCEEPQGVMDQEFAFTNALQQAATFEITGAELNLFNADGTRLVQAVAAPDVSGQVASEAPVSEGTLIGPTWQWVGTAYGNDTEQAVDSANYTIQFLPDGSLGFQADCNTGGGSYQVDGSSLAIQLGAMTMMACPPESLADKYLMELGQVASYVIQDGMLYLNLAMDTGNMKFVQSASKTEGEAPSAGAEAPQPGGDVLVDTSWQWLETVSAAETTAPTFPDRYQLDFQPEGRVGLRADCNVGNGAYKTDGASLGIQVTALTRAACPKGSKSQLFVDQLNQSASYVIEGENLIITLQGDAGQMKFRPAQ